MTHHVAFRLSDVPARRPVKDPRPGCPGTLHLVGKFWGPALAAVPARRIYQCAACGALIGFQGDDVVSFVRRARR